MLFSSRAVALLLSALICIATTALLSLVEGVPQKALWLVGSLSFSSSFLLIYSTYEFLVFREINKVYKLLEGIKKREVKQVRRSVAAHAGYNPIKKLNSEIMSLANRQEAEIAELRKIETYRREFIADLSHELKTPLFAAQGFIDTLLDGAAEDENVRERFLQKAAASLDGLNLMVQELLTLSQLETGIIQMKREIFDLAALPGEVADQLEEKAGSRHITLNTERPAGKQLWVEGDRLRIGQVLANLAENAIKYGNQGGEVILELRQDKEFIEVIVRDNGPGIPPEHLARIFERFYRIDKSRNKDIAGSGLGLSIVKQIVEAHGSRISVSSQMGRGTVFEFRLKKARSR